MQFVNTTTFMPPQHLHAAFYSVPSLLAYILLASLLDLLKAD
jgi:hypothetical protein